VPAIEQRLRRLENRAQLQDLRVRYFVPSDDDPTIGACFADAHEFGGLGVRWPGYDPQPARLPAH
jgi:hypothetical protein